MAIAELVTAEQYLHTSFEHDAELVDGRIVERAMSTWEHSRIQRYLIRRLDDFEKLGLYGAPEQRVRTRADRYRIPDMCVVTEKPGPDNRGIVTAPPYLCIEILSPEDRASETLEKVREYLTFGVKWVWVIDPVTRTGQVHSCEGVKSVENGVFSTDRLEVDLTAADV